MSTKKWFAMYKGDEFIAQGTIPMLAKFLKVKENTIYFYMSNVYDKRQPIYDEKYIFINVEEEN